MAQRVQGTEDLYGGYMRAWQHMQDIARELFGAYGFDMIETPAIEQVDTFVHGIGESTDVVRKEMFRVVSGALLGDLHRTEKSAILVVTHDPQVAAVAQKVHFLKDGKIAASYATEGDAEMVSKRYLETYRS